MEPMKYVPKSITRAAGRTVLRAQKNSPTLLFVGGIVGVIGATALTCRATLKVERVLVEHENQALKITRAEAGRGNVGRDDSIDFQRERYYLTLRTAGNLCKLYAPTVIVMGVSIACLTKSHRILTDRNTQLTAAYVGLQKFLEGYRGRVREAVGEEKERDIYYASTAVELAEDTKDGPRKIFGSAPGQRSPYSQLFDDTNSNWQESHEFNTAWLNIMQDRLTNRLRAQGSLMLNEVYDTLDMPRTPNGSLCGWMIGRPDSDDFVEFTVLPVRDYQGTLMIDFNVAGVVYDMLSGRISGRKPR